MINYTHVRSVHTGRMVSLDQAPGVIGTIEFNVRGFLLVDIDRIEIDQHGQPCRNRGGWSYGHVQNRQICAGAGGLNSLPIASLLQ